MLYICYGLLFSSDIELPELTEMNDSSICGNYPLIKIKIAHQTEILPPEAVQTNPHIWHCNGATYIIIPDVVCFFIKNGTEIRITPGHLSSSQVIRSLLFGPAMAALLFQRGIVVMRGATIQIGNNAMLIIGRSGVGKSTLAAKLISRGHKIIADDIAPIDENCVALQGPGQIKLWRESLDLLNISAEYIPKVRPEIQRFRLPCQATDSSEPLKVRWIYVMESGKGIGYHINKLSGINKFSQINNNLYNSSMLASDVLRANYLAWCGRLSSLATMTEISRDTRGADINIITNYIISELS